MPKLPKTLWILGRLDREMNEIKTVLDQTGQRHTLARGAKGAVKAFESNLVSTIKDEKIILDKDLIYLVECKIKTPSSSKVIRIDHHRPGDPGYNCGASDYLNGSSLGQALRILGVSPTTKQKYIAAADHCLRSAYQGLCKDIDPDEMLAFRLQNGSKGLSWKEMGLNMTVNYRKLLSAPRIQLDPSDPKTKVSFVFYRQEPFMNDASCYFNLPYVSLDRGCGHIFCNGSRDIILAFVSYFAMKHNISIEYGNPNREFAGGYTPKKGLDFSAL